MTKGYIIFPDSEGVNIKLWAENRSGDWHDLDDKYSSGDIQSVNIFQLSINHETNPQDKHYAYIVLPNIKKEDMSNYWANIPISILNNSDAIQAVRHEQLDITEIAFYSPGELPVNEALTVSVDRAAVVMLRESVDVLDVSIADPMHKETQIVMNVTLPLEDDTNIELNSTNNSSQITFDLPQGIHLGEGVHARFEIIPEPISNFIYLLIITFIFRLFVKRNDFVSKIMNVRIHVIS